MSSSAHFRSGKRRRVQLKRRRGGKRAANAAAEVRAAARRAEKELAERIRGHVLVNPANLRETNSYSTPDFVERGYYLDRPFRCKDCGVAQVWTATQQKWWYEWAKGDVWTVAVRCRPCRRRERERKGVARMVAAEGKARA